ncbi:MAG: hypothetical protein ACRDJE_05625 [Dehalococcoidia bacterium]
MDDIDDLDDNTGDDDHRVEPRWDIRREGRDWVADEVQARWQLTPERIELLDGKIFGTEKDRRLMLGLLLELLGADVAVRMGDPSVWRAAVAALDEAVADSESS